MWKKLYVFSILTKVSAWNMSTGMVDGAVMVTSDMTMSLISVLLNLMVLNALREKENILSKTHNLVLANICCANLVNF